MCVGDMNNFVKTENVWCDLEKQNFVKLLFQDLLTYLDSQNRE